MPGVIRDVESTVRPLVARNGNLLEIVLELDEGPLFVSYPVDVDVSDLRESMVLTLRWTDGQEIMGLMT